MTNKYKFTGETNPPYRIPAEIDERVVIVELVEALASKGLTLSNAHGLLVIHRRGDQP